ncbi:MAG: hypothetical protein M3P47_04705 [Pseudomonadota bacterium]|nr:hypothetical protein [Pseudomonadota bacterium]
MPTVKAGLVHLKTVYEHLLARGKSKMSPLGAVIRKLEHLYFDVSKLNNRINTFPRKMFVVSTRLGLGRRRPRRAATDLQSN